MGFIDFYNKLIRYSFYGIFLLVPFIFTSNTSELFELNKMWLAWALTILIGFGWISKMVVEKTYRIQRTPLDIPIVIFLISQLISTIFSLDQRISFFGYYSRFNGGFLSLFSYILLYYAFASNFTRDDIKSFLKISIIAGIVVALWGLPSHFGNDPTCLMFRGTFDVSCWTDAFKPTVRIFSTLGQPAWLSSYLAILTPFIMGYLVILSEHKKRLAGYISDKKVVVLFIILLLFYVDLLFTNTRAGFLAFWAANVFFWGMLFLRHLKSYKKVLPIFITINLIFILSNFIFGTPISQLNKIEFSSLTRQAVAPAPAEKASATETSPASPYADGINITDSANIRVLVWNGAIEAWKAHPIIGTGVETFAFAYYQFRPAAHNLTSEWDYLYNKAHNEYLNYLTTTGILGLGSYLAIFALLGFLALRKYFLTPKAEQLEMNDFILSVTFLASLISILIANFFGFSVVITNIYLLFLALWYVMLTGMVDPKKVLTYSFIKSKYDKASASQWTIVTVLGAISLFLLFLLLRFWQADVSYALGNNLNKVGDFQNAYPQLTRATTIRQNEPVFQDELALNLGTIATALYKAEQASTAAQLATQAMTLSDKIVTEHPNNVLYWKSRTRILYMLSGVEPMYLKPALDAILTAQKLAPTDAKISYNVGVIQGKSGQIENAVESLTKTIELKNDYRDAYFARGLFYRQLGTNSGGFVTNKEFADKAIVDMRYILKNLDKTDEDVLKALKNWNVNP